MGRMSGPCERSPEEPSHGRAAEVARRSSSRRPTALSATVRAVANREGGRDAVAVEMRANPNIILLGEGTGERGGSFAHTKGLFQEFGPERLIDTPISELGFTGAGVGAAATGLHPIIDLMF